MEVQLGPRLGMGPMGDQAIFLTFSGPRDGVITLSFSCTRDWSNVKLWAVAYLFKKVTRTSCDYGCLAITEKEALWTSAYKGL